MTAVFLVALAYLLGSVSPSVLLGRAFAGIDVRDHGSGNAGTTNAFRVLGKKLGAAVLATDVLKGFVPVLLARLAVDSWIVVLVALAAITGHNWSVFLRGRGGKGVATGVGAVLAMMPVVAAALVAVFLAVLTLTSLVSLASISATLIFPLLAIATGKPPAYIAFSVIGAAIVVWAHRDNIRRLIRREEQRSRVPWIPSHRRRERV